MDTPAVPTTALDDHGRSRSTAALRHCGQGEQQGEPGHEPPPDLVCSARGCTHHAEFGLLWNNPSLHTPERRKTWLACPEHREHLSDFLGARGFLREVVGVGEVVGAGELNRP